MLAPRSFSVTVVSSFLFGLVCVGVHLQHSEYDWQAMGPKASLAILLPMASMVIILLAPTVESCVNFQAWWQALSGPDAYLLNAELWDDSRNPVCWANQVYVDSNGPDPFLNLDCKQGYSAVFDTINNWDVTYISPSGNWVFDVPWYDENQCWYTCEFCASATACFVPI